MFTYQDGDSTSGTYGVFRFHVNDAPLASDNSTEFALAPVGWLLSRALLPDAIVAPLIPRIQAALNAIDAHEVCQDYTNVCLMQQAIRLSIGAAFAASSDTARIADGSARLAKAKSELEGWAASVKTGGVHEFDSTTYGEIDLEALALAHQGALLAKDAMALARVDGAADYLWADFSANVFAPRATLTMPSSRTYDFAAGQGVLAYALWLEGLIDAPWSSIPADLMMAAWLPSDEPTAYRPPARALCLSTPSTREVVSEWQQQSSQSVRGRYAYLTSDYALGSAGADYPVGSYIDIDALIGGALASSPSTPMLSIVPDWLDSPVTPIQTGNFMKVTHLPLDPAVAQRQGALLALLRVPARDPGYTGVSLVNLTTNLIAPAQVDSVLVDGVSIDPTVRGTASTHPILVVKNTSGVMAMAVVDVSGLDCVTGSGAISETGTPHVDVLPLAAPPADPAVRLAIRHLDAPPADTSTLDPCFARVALLMIARHCDGTGCDTTLASDVAAAVRAATVSFDPSTGAWAVTVHAPSGPVLHVARGTATAGDIRTQDVDGATPRFVPLSVNGASISLLP
jgi:hypothetical protein